MTQTIYILNGPNLNLLGQRQPEIYGRETLADVETECRALAKGLGFELKLFQSNHEGVIIDTIHEARKSACGIVINPGAFTHTSVAILDALDSFEGPVIEVHISNVHKRGILPASFLCFASRRRRDRGLGNRRLQGRRAPYRAACCEEMTESRIAVAGAGLIGRRHVAAMKQAAGARLAAIVDPLPAAADFAAAEGVPYFSTLEAMLATGVAGGVILATPNALHVEGGLACVRAGLPVLVEKPLATDVAAARVLVEAAEVAGVPLAVGHHRRHNPLIAAAKEMILAGEIGTPVSVQAIFWLMKPDDYFDVAWRREPGAGPIFLT